MRLIILASLFLGLVNALFLQNDYEITMKVHSEFDENIVKFLSDQKFIKLTQRGNGRAFKAIVKADKMQYVKKFLKLTGKQNFVNIIKNKSF